MHSELLQQQYDFELEQRNSIATAINIPIVAATITASAASFVLNDYQYDHSVTTYAFLTLMSVTGIAIITSILYIFKSFWNYEYKKLPNSTSLIQHHEALVTWHTNNTNSQPNMEADKDFAIYLNGRLADAADWNSQNNIIRGNYLHRATATIAIAFLMLIPAGLFYVYNKNTSPEKVHHIQIIGQTNDQAKGNSMSRNTSNNSNTPAAASTPAPAPTPSTKPVGPPNVVFKGTTDLPKPNAGKDSGKK